MAADKNCSFNANEHLQITFTILHTKEYIMSHRKPVFISCFYPCHILCVLIINRKLATIYTSVRDHVAKRVVWIIANMRQIIKLIPHPDVHDNTMTSNQIPGHCTLITGFLRKVNSGRFEWDRLWNCWS